MRTNILVNFIRKQSISALDSAEEVVIEDVGLFEFDVGQVVPLQVDVILGLLEFVESLNDVGQHFNLFLFAQLGVEVESLKRLLQQRKHHQIRNQQVIVSFSRLRMQI